MSPRHRSDLLIWLGLLLTASLEVGLSFLAIPPGVRPILLLPSVGMAVIVALGFMRLLSAPDANLGIALARADSADFGQRRQRRGPRLRHFAQGRIVKYHIGRHASLFGNIAAQGTQRFEWFWAGDSDLHPGATPTSLTLAWIGPGS